ncbi:MAG TPA: hypothetical protein VFV73_25465 [Streptosporangiaceae bacterium]|nr:hypothetical protein [Streptosporangiaceae bacterium]
MSLTTREAGAVFADIVYADQQWVDADFEALISASFCEPPAPPPAPPRVPPHPGTPPPPGRPPTPGPAVRAFPATGPDHGRPRSPPAHLPGRPPPLAPGRARLRTTAISTGHRPGGMERSTSKRNL